MKKPNRNSKESTIQTLKGPAIYGEERMSNGHTINWIRYLEVPGEVPQGDSQSNGKG